MGKLEEENRKIIRRTKIQEGVLLALVSGRKSSSSLATKLIMDGIFGSELTPSPRANEIVRTAANRLYKKGLLGLQNGHYFINNNGEKILDCWRRIDFKLERPKKWDRKWRVIIFDIPEKKRNVRDHIRTLFKSAGFYLLQDSVWVYPYDCEDVLTLLKSDLGVGKDILYLIVDELENDKHLRESFGLL